MLANVSALVNTKWYLGKFIPGPTDTNADVIRKAFLSTTRATCGSESQK